MLGHLSMLYIQALQLVSKGVAINLLEHLSMLYIQASELVSKEVAINLLEYLSMLYIQALELVSKKWQSTCWSIVGRLQSWLATMLVYSGFRAGSKEVPINLLEHLSMLYIQALELVSKEVAINLLEHLSMLYTSGFRAG